MEFFDFILSFMNELRTLKASSKVLRQIVGPKVTVLAFEPDTTTKIIQKIVSKQVFQNASLKK